MNGYLKQSTASQVRAIGPFISDSDFKTVQNSLTINNTDVKLKKNGAASGSKNSGGATADGSFGLYHLTWDATDTATVGELYGCVSVAGALPVFFSYVVLTAAVYDAIFGSSALGYVADQPVNVTKWAGTATTTAMNAIKTALAKGTDITGFNDLSAAQVNTECDTALSDIQLDHLLQLADPGGVVANNSFWAKLSSKSATAAYSSYDNTTDSQEALRDNQGTPQTGDCYPRLGAPAGASVSADIAAVKSDTATLLTRITATLFSGMTSLPQWLGSMAGKQTPNATAQTEMRATGAGSGSYDATTDSNEAVRDRGDAAWITGAGGDPWATALPGAYSAGQAGKIIGDNLNATVSSRAVPGDAMALTSGERTTLSAVIWNVLTSTLTTVGSIGKLLVDNPDSAGVTTLLTRIPSTLFTGITSLGQWLGMMMGKQVGNSTARTEIRATGAGSGTFDETTDSVEALRDRGDAAWITGAGGDPWATALPGAYGAGSAGNILGNNLNATVSSRATPAQVQTELGTYGALKPTSAGRTLDVSTGGEAGLDWANIGTPASVQNLSNTTIATVGTLTNAPPDSAGITTLLARIPAALFSGITSLKEWLGLLAGKQAGNSTARTEIRNSGAGSGTFDETTDSQEALRDRGDAAWVTGAAPADPWATLVPGAYGAGSAGKILGDNLDAKVSTRMPTSSYVAPDNAGIAQIKAKTDTIPANPASVSDIPTAIQNADALLKRDMAAVSGEASRSPLNGFRLLRNKWSAVEIPNTLVVKKEDDTTTAWQAPLTTDSSAAPITSMDPT